MPNPIDTLFALNGATQDLDTLQSWVDRARTYAGINQAAQLVLDRKQTELDEKRAKIELLKRHIASSN